MPSGVTSTARPGSSTLATKGFSAPEEASTAANRSRVWPSTVPKSPPAYRVSSVTASARTVAGKLGWNDALGVQLAMSIAARLETGVPLTAPKDPPA